MARTSDQSATRLAKVPAPTYAEMRDAIGAALHDLFLAQGVTTVYEMPHAVEPVRIYQELRDAGKLPVRLSVSYFIGPGFAFELEDLLATGLRTGFGDDWLKVGAVKIILDGAGVSAATHDPHPGTDHRGTLTRERELLARQVLAAHRAGWQIWIHAIGDRAQDLALDAFEAALREVPRADARHRGGRYRQGCPDPRRVLRRGSQPIRRRICGSAQPCCRRGARCP